MILDKVFFYAVCPERHQDSLNLMDNVIEGRDLYILFHLLAMNASEEELFTSWKMEVHVK